MQCREYRGKGLVEGRASGPALVVKGRISFLGDVDPETGVLRSAGQTLEGRILVFEGGRGSTVGSYIIYGLSRKGLAPAAMVAVEAEPIIVAGCVLGGIPLVAGVPRRILDEVVSGEPLVIDAWRGVVLAGEGCAGKP
jgi:predicted aconitase with swiveling domain